MLYSYNLTQTLRKKFFSEWFPNWSPDVALRYMFIVKEIKKDKSIKKILDVGSGSLGITPYLKRKVTGIDLEFLAPKTQLLKRVVGHAENLPFINGSFDAVVCADLLEHMPRDKRPLVIKEILRVARKKIFIIFPSGRKSYEEDSFFYKYIKRTTGRNDPFIYDHIKYGLPKTEEVISNIPKNTKVRILGCTNIYLHHLILLAQFSNNRAGRFISSVIFILLTPLFQKINFDPVYRKLIIIDNDKSSK